MIKTETVKSILSVWVWVTTYQCFVGYTEILTICEQKGVVLPQLVQDSVLPKKGTTPNFVSSTEMRIKYLGKRNKLILFTLNDISNIFYCHFIYIL